KKCELQALALQLFAVSSYSASCKHFFLVLKWFYSQRRTKLAVNQVEDMCKLHTYYITNAKYELPYYAVDTSECSLYKKMINTLTES
ncbi:3602_t:CDS:1, partial [Rhizophagus irregularis]